MSVLLRSLSLTPERKVGLELAFRVLPTSDKSPKEATLEGYRFYKQHDGQGKAEWFTLKVQKGAGSSKLFFGKTLVLLLIKPFSDFENIVFKQKQYSIWQNQQAGTLLFGDQSLVVDPEPILRDWLKACASIQKCSDSYEENGRYASVRNYNQASSICQNTVRILIDRTLLRLSLNEKTKQVLNEVPERTFWTNEGEAGKIRETLWTFEMDTR